MLRDHTIVELNAATAAIPIAAARLPAVALELRQLAQAAEAARPRVTFDSEPAGFLLALARFAPAP